VEIPLRADLAPDLPLFNVATGLAKILDRDLPVAGIPRHDECGRVVYVQGGSDKLARGKLRCCSDRAGRR